MEILGCAARITVANRLKYMDMSFVRSSWTFVGNSTVSFISRVESKSPSLTKKASDAFTHFYCSTGAIGGLSHSLPFGGDCTAFGGL